MRWVRPTPCASLPAFEWEGWMRRREFIAGLGGAVVWPHVTLHSRCRLWAIFTLVQRPARCS